MSGKNRENEMKQKNEMKLILARQTRKPVQCATLFYSCITGEQMNDSGVILNPTSC